MSCSSVVLGDERQSGHFVRAKSEGATIVSEPQDGFERKKHLLLENFLVY